MRRDLYITRWHKFRNLLTVCSQNLSTVKPPALASVISALFTPVNLSQPRPSPQSKTLQHVRDINQIFGWQLYGLPFTVESTLRPDRQQIKPLKLIETDSQTGRLERIQAY